MVMENIKELQAADAKINKVFLPLVPKLHHYGSSEYPKTAFLLVQLVLILDSIKQSVFNLYEAGQMYSATILYRALIEHLLKWHYVSTHLCEDRNDQVGIDYWTFAVVYDGFKQSNAYKRMFAFHETGMETEKPTVFKLFRDYNPEYAQWSVKEIKEKCNQFERWEMIKYINSKRPSKGKAPSPFLQIHSLLYPDLSSFLHAGYSAYESLIKYIKDDDEERAKLRTRVEFSFIFSVAVKRETLDIFYGIISPNNTIIKEAWENIKQIEQEYKEAKDVKTPPVPED